MNTQYSDDLASVDATELANLIRRGEISALEAVDAAIVRAQAVQPQLNFMAKPLYERARQRARAGTLTGPFAGVPFLLKDMYDMKGSKTRWGSRLTWLTPVARKNSPQVDAYEAAGLVIIGRSSMSEFGYLPTTESLACGPTRNPWDVDRTPGGSSGGAAAAVAAGVVPMADAADGGGSIRIPAACCGLFGLKPSFGRLIGDQAQAAGFDLTAQHCVSRTVRDSAGLFAAMERTGASAALPPVGAVVGPSARRLRVGYFMNSIADGQAPDREVVSSIESTLRLLEGLGHHVESTSLPFDGTIAFRDFVTLFTNSAAEAVELARKALWGFGPNRFFLEPFTLGMAVHAQRLPADELENAKARLKAAASSYDAWFNRFDVIVSPVLAQPPVRIGTIHGALPFETVLERASRFAVYTEIQNAFGAPAMSVPLHWSTTGLPIGVQFASRVGDERTLFELAYELEAARPWANRRPSLCA
ncbi:amidase [Burkholderia sp. AU6039]|uniref:amidase n=1 Tax=Burkholderia sp. AU6039 TaxID=2015344 RepID=UPI000B7A2115|nr:amidase [Burkholderia sp. AU6039]OXJ19795.1 6-aminohexanoate hydrolase [Burkholderia sp. AU6039]